MRISDWSSDVCSSDLGGFPYVVEGETVVEQADEGADRAGGVIVLRLRQQQRRAPLEIAQIDVVAEGRADDFAPRIDDQHHLRLGIVPGRIRPPADRRDRKGTRLNSSHYCASRMPSTA